MTKENIRRHIGVAVLGSALLVASGCASTELKELRSMVEDAKASAERAAATANDAQATATEAQQAASDAAARADQAIRTAEQSQACCNANSEKMERMFQRSMSK